ncbi:ribosome small subunit-dependent GTPase A [Chitinimonas sp.]|uniref:ribosome small subunit-dependent GTPase A n=1 Tax=Chitinimonas sp. TaxID=1934313 RepID=UPI0035AFBFCB
MIEFDYAALRAIGLTQALINQLYASEIHDDAQLARITELQRDRLTVHDGRQEILVRAMPHLVASLQAQATALSVGDWVLVQHNALNEPWIVAQLPPLTHLARRANDGRRQPLVSNVDTALLVMGLDHDFNLRRLERYAALVRSAGVAAVVVLSKVDTCADAAAKQQQVQDRLPASVPVLAINGLDPASVAQLDPWLGAGQTLVLLGSSGAGKSTLTNTLTAGSAGQSTGAVREADSRGRHTTRARSLHCCADGSCIIDTPGLRTWRPDEDSEGISAGFEDIDALAGQCRFRDCQHEDEPGCAVREVVPADRLRNYHKLLREARRGTQTALERKAATAKWKVIGKAGYERQRQKRGGA